VSERDFGAKRRKKKEKHVAFLAYVPHGVLKVVAEGCVREEGCK